MDKIFRTLRWKTADVYYDDYPWNWWQEDTGWPDLIGCPMTEVDRLGYGLRINPRHHPAEWQFWTGYDQETLDWLLPRSVETFVSAYYPIYPEAYRWGLPETVGPAYWTASGYDLVAWVELPYGEIRYRYVGEFFRDHKRPVNVPCVFLPTLLAGLTSAVAPTMLSGIAAMVVNNHQINQAARRRRKKIF